MDSQFNVSSSPLISLWNSVDQETIDSASQLFLNSSAKINWMIKNRGGIAQQIDNRLALSLYKGPKESDCKALINRIYQNEGSNIEQFVINVESYSLEGLIFFPMHSKSKKASNCVLFHNPNGITVPQFIVNGKLSFTPQKIAELKKCPIILYDYRGTGINQNITNGDSFEFQPSYESVLQDGLAMLQYALNRFKRVEVWGTSLGGGVATVTLDSFLQSHPKVRKKVTLVNHDSFTTTSRVFIPNHLQMADYIGWLQGNQMNAKESMEKLVDRRVKIIVIGHQLDPVIPKGARMADFCTTINHVGNVRIIESAYPGHANLSDDIIDWVKALIAT